MLLDVKDVDGRWFVGHVISSEERYARVRYGMYVYMVSFKTATSEGLCGSR
jgi:hypothetical protein